jgi:hypothetical protein
MELNVLAQRQDSVYPGRRTTLIVTDGSLIAEPHLRAAILGSVFDHGRARTGSADFVRQRQFAAAVTSGGTAARDIDSDIARRWPVDANASDGGCSPGNGWVAPSVRIWPGSSRA